MKKLTSKFAPILLFLISLLFGTLFTPLISSTSTSVYAIPEDGNTSETAPEEGTTTDGTTDQNPTESPENTEGGTETEATDENSEEEPENTCQGQTGALSWVICPLTTLLSTAVDSLYGLIEEQLEVNPISTDADSPIRRVWQYVRDITNVVFIVFMLIVIYSQITGVGLNNYGIKRVLPRLIIAIILVNLSFIICSLAVDVSNILGAGLTEFFDGIEATVFSGATMSLDQISWSSVATGVLTGAGLAALGIVAAGGLGAVFWMLLLALLSALISVAIGLITIALRQGLVAVLIMISPLAFVAYLLPNTEKWFEKWKDLLFKMLIFYPMFSFLFGACKVIGWALVLSADSLFGVIIGLAIQVLPLFLAVSLMKMSGTILGAVSNKLNSLANPARGGLARWTGSHAEQRRQHYLSKNTMPGAKLRNYLAYRQGLRELDTSNAASAAKDQTMTRVYRKATSSTGRDANGNDTWSKRANRYTRTAKLAGVRGTQLGHTKDAYTNLLNEYGDHFKDRQAQTLSGEHAEAFLESMREQYRLANNAQADQDFLLDKYLSAQTRRYSDPRDFNRLIGGAAGSLGHSGENSIIGQVIAKNAAIEARRRSEANIIMNKFSLDKNKFRAMTFDCASIDDDGFETDEFGHVIEDQNFKHIEGARPHREWPHYIAVHKKTRAEITSDEYLRLSDEDRAQYTRVRYMDILNDSGDPVSRIYADEAGYMKEGLIRDITIGDPINRRYLQSIGNANPDAPDQTEGANDTGLLRKYHSTISAAMLTSKYKEHAGEVTPMITAQADRGFINTNGQYLIAAVDSLIKSAKSGSFLQNDAYSVKTWQRILESLTDPEAFAEQISDADISNYRNVNGLHLHGMRLTTDADGNMIWQKIDRNDPSITVEDKKNFIKHSMMPDLAKKLYGMMNRNLSPNIMDAQKPDTTEALYQLMETIGKLGLANLDENTPFEDRLNPDPKKDPLAAKNPRILTQTANDIQVQRQSILNGGTSNSGNTGSTGSGTGQPSGNNDVINTLYQQLQRSNARNEVQSFANIRSQIEQLFIDNLLDIHGLCAMIRAIFDMNPALAAFSDELEIILENYENGPTPGSTEEAIYQATHGQDVEQDAIYALQEEIINFLDEKGIF